MMKNAPIFFLVSLIFCGGCFFHHGPKPAKQSVAISSSEFDSAKVLKPLILNQGGKLLIVPFTAGVGVEADENLNRISLMIVKGITEELKSASNFEILDGRRANSADIVLQGHIVQRKQPGKMSKLMRRKREYYLSVDGKMVHRKTGEYVLRFVVHDSAKMKGNTELKVAERLGKIIGQYILDNIEESSEENLKSIELK